MKTPIRHLAGLAGLFVPAVALCAATVDEEKEKAAVIAVIEEGKNAFLALDEGRMAAPWIQQPTSLKLFVQDAKETRLDGFAAIAADTEKYLKEVRTRDPAQRWRVRFSDTSVILQGDSAWATCRADWEGPTGGAAATATQSRVYVLQKEDGQWKLALMAIAGLQPPPSPLAGTWELVSAKSIVDGKETVSFPDALSGRQHKLYSRTHFLFVGNFASGGKESDSFGGGTYTLNGEEYVETRIFHIAKERVGKSVHYKLVVTGNTMTMSGPLLPEE